MFFFKKKQMPEILKTWASKHGFDCSNINSRIDNSMTALMYAAKHNDQSVVRILLQEGCDVNLLNDDKNNALWFACISNNREIVRRLISHGCNINNQNINGATCLMHSAFRGDVEIIKELIKAGSDITKTTNDGFNALDSATTVPVLKLLKPVFANAGLTN